MPSEVKGQYRGLHDLALERPAEAVRRLEPLADKYPTVPEQFNLLAAAYQGTGQGDKADAIIERNYRGHSDYLFARIDMADTALGR
jgi:hypothetical protein